MDRRAALNCGLSTDVNRTVIRHVRTDPCARCLYALSTLACAVFSQVRAPAFALKLHVFRSYFAYYVYYLIMFSDQVCPTIYVGPGVDRFLTSGCSVA